MAQRTQNWRAGALADVAERWQNRLDSGWTPPAQAGGFPWTMIRRSLAALLPGLRAPVPVSGVGPDRVALILAGNTPLLSWPALAACVRAGSAVSVKMSRDETLWTRLFVESLADIAPDIAATISLHVWPGDDPRTAALIAESDAVIAYGSDATLAAIRETACGRPFLGFGHALSVGFAGARSAQPGDFASDILLYDQGGCLSPHVIFTEGDAGRALAVGDALADALPIEAEALGLEPVADAGIARTVREARDLALFEPGTRVVGDEGLRWTVIVHDAPSPMNAAPVGHGVVTVMPLADPVAQFGPMLGMARGRLSSVGVAGELGDAMRAAIRAEGVSRICPAGTMQTPPLNWPNGNIDLLAELVRIGQRSADPPI